MKFTTLEQSKKLAEVFGEVATGSYYEVKPNGNVETIENRFLAYIESKTYSRHTLDTLLERLPASITDKGHTYFLRLIKVGEGKYATEYCNGFSKSSFVLFNESKPAIDALYDLTIWLHKNGYLKEESK